MVLYMQNGGYHGDQLKAGAPRRAVYNGTVPRHCFLKQHQQPGDSLARQQPIT